MPVEVITAIISAITTMLVSIGTWHVTMRQHRAKTQEDINGAITAISKEVLSVKDDVTQVNSTVQQHLSIIDLKIDTLSERVDKHNNVIERTYALEKEVALSTERIHELQERVG